MQVLVLASGGLDSATLAHSLHNQGHTVRLLGINYGQRHVKELDAAAVLAKRLNAQLHTIDLSSSGLTQLLTGSALTDDSVAVPDGHYHAESMAATIVPNRNAIMLSLAFGVAASAACDAVALAVHGGDHFIYPDCRPAFVEAFDAMERLSQGEASPIALLAPFLEMTKAEIVSTGHAAGVNFAETWSCYRGEALHCGRCGTCVERREAFAIAQVADPTEYAPAAVPR